MTGRRELGLSRLRFRARGASALRTGASLDVALATGHSHVLTPLAPHSTPRSYAEMDGAEKNKISHRYRALEKLRKFLTEQEA